MICALCGVDLALDDRPAEGGGFYFVAVEANGMEHRCPRPPKLVEDQEVT